MLSRFLLKSFSFYPIMKAKGGMVMTTNKEIMARNIQYYMEKKNVTATEVCSELGVKQNTFSDWVNAKTYPRIDAIEKMARYFGISKAFLVEDIKPIDIFTDEERNLMLEYRNADQVTQEMVKRMLKYKEV